jgi:hypothetical protein
MTECNKDVSKGDFKSLLALVLFCFLIPYLFLLFPSLWHKIVLFCDIENVALCYVFAFFMGICYL